MNRNHKSSYFKILFVQFSLLAYFGCAGKKITETQISSLAQDASKLSSDSVQTSNKELRLSGIKTGKSAGEQYLVVKFHQNDTEVEMVLDPNSTNLALDLVRGPDGYLEVMKGDSLLYQKNHKPSEDLLTGLEDKGGNSEHLTDELIQDINLAQKMFYERRYEEALRVLQDSLAKKKTATAYALGGSIYYVNGEIEEAVNAWENALQINPNLDQVRQLVMRYKN